MYRSKLIRVGVGALLSVAALSVGAVGEVAAHATDSIMSGVPESDQQTTPVVLSGTFVDQAGQPVVGGDVGMFAWPANEDALADTAAEGTSIELIPISKTSSDATGHYSLRIPSGTDLSTVMLPDGKVNVEVSGYVGASQVAASSAVIDGAGGSATTSTSADPSAASTAPALGDPTSAPPPTDTTSPIPTVSPTTPAPVTTPVGLPKSFEPSPSALIVRPRAAAKVSALTTTTTATTTVQAAQVNLTGETLATDEPDSCGACGRPPYPGCTATAGKQAGKHYGIVGQTYSWTSGVSHQFVYERGSVSKIGVGVESKNSAETVSWKSEGERESESTITQDFGTYGDWTYKYYLTAWNFRQWHVKCPDGSKHDEMRTGSYQGGQIVKNAGTPSATHCMPHSKGTTTTLDTKHAVTWTNGFSFTFLGVGIDLSVQTGYNTHSYLVYHNGSSGTRYYCGMGGTEANNPYILVAKTYAS